MMKSIKYSTKVFSILTFLFWFANSLPLALLTLLLQSRGLNLMQASVFFGLHALTVVLLEVPTGSLADIIGRKNVTIWSGVLMMIGFGIFLFAFSYPVLIFGGMIYGASRALASGALDAWFVDTVKELDPEVDLQPLFAKSGMMTLVGLALGTFVGGVIPLAHPYLPLQDSAIFTALSLPLVASLFIQVIRLALVIILVKEEQRTAEKSLRGIASSLPAFVKDAVKMSQNSKILRWLLLVSFGGGFVMTNLENLWQPHFAELLGPERDSTIIFGIIMAGNFVLGAVGNMLSSALGKRFQGRLGLMAGIVEILRGFMLLLLVLQENAFISVAFFWLVYFGMGLNGPAIGTILHGEIPAELRSTMLSIQSMVSYIGVFAGSLILGAIAERFSIAKGWMVGSFMLMLLLLPYLKINRLYQPAVEAEKEKPDGQLQTV